MQAEINQMNPHRKVLLNVITGMIKYSEIINKLYNEKKPRSRQREIYIATENLNIFESYKKINVKLFPNDAKLYQDFVIIIRRVDCPDKAKNIEKEKEDFHGNHFLFIIIAKYFWKLTVQLYDCYTESMEDHIEQMGEII